MAGDLSFERAFAVLLFTPEFFTPLRVLATRYHAAAAGARTLVRIKAVEDVVVPAAPTGPWRVPPSEAGIAFRDVTVHYSGRTVPALDRVSFAIGAGTLTAISGVTGAGKSTVAALLLRFLEPDEGSIEVGEVPLAQTEPITWRRRIAWLPQGATLFSGSVLDNLRLGRQAATLEEVRVAAHAAAIDTVIDRLPDGYDTPVGEAGARFSGGERQRLALARALLRDAPLLLLDEPTSHLDPASADRVRATLRAERGRRTIVAITHDPRILADADAVITLARPGPDPEGPAPSPERRPVPATAVLP
jgi:ATP-binding cassette subfamily C protein CydD